MNRKINTQGFTIVELLIVIVVIAILAAITIVAFNGVTARANDSSTQSSISQIYKKLKMTESSDGLSREIAETAKLNSLTSGISMSSFDTSRGYPLSIGWVYNWESEVYESAFDLVVAGVSKSGKVFYASDATGGVAEVIPEYTYYRNMYESSILEIEQALLDPDRPEEDKDYLRSSLESSRAALVSINASEENNAGLWRMMPKPCTELTEQTGLVCISEDMITPFDTGSYGFLSGYVYDVESSQWYPRTGHSVI